MIGRGVRPNAHEDSRATVVQARKLERRWGLGIHPGKEGTTWVETAAGRLDQRSPPRRLARIVYRDCDGQAGPQKCRTVVGS